MNPFSQTGAVLMRRERGQGAMARGQPWLWVLADALPHEDRYVSLSDHVAGRWLDAQEFVEQVPAPAGVVDWVHAMAQDHCTPQVKIRQRAQSFQTLNDRFGQPASVSTGDRRGRKPAREQVT